MAPMITLDKYLFFGTILNKIRVWKIKRYKKKKIKETKKSPEKMYHLHFKIGVKDNNDSKLSDTVFDINIPATGYYYAKQKLERFIIENIDMEIIEFTSKSMETEIKTIGIDLDSTLIETNAASAAAKELGYDYVDKDVLHWNHLNFPEDLRSKIMEYFVNPIFMCDNAKPIEKAQETIKRWTEEGHNIVLITARSEPIRVRTIAMVNRLFPEITDINFVGMDQSKKDVMRDKGIDVWIDDAPHGVVDAMDIDIPTYLVSNNYTKYNWKVKNDSRLKDVVKIIADIKWK